MFPDLERLIKLQRLDSTIDDARRTIAAHPQRLAAAEAHLSDAKQLVDAAKERLKENQEARRALEKDVALYQGRLSKYRDQQAAVKTNKEYQALSHELETAQQELGGVEEKILERMMEADTLAADISQAETALAAQQKEIDAEKKEVTEELASVEAAMAKATEAKTAVLAALER